jgi:hypothetical protein
MTHAGPAGVLLRYTFRDLFSFHVRLAELFTTDMPLLLERLQRLHGRIVSIAEPEPLHKV